MDPRAPQSGFASTSRESTRGRQLALPAGPFDADSSMSRTGESRADARRNSRGLNGMQCLRPTHAIAETATPIAHDHRKGVQPQSSQRCTAFLVATTAAASTAGQVLYWTRSRNTIDEEFATTENILNIRMRLLF